jgi:hypothetical protein
MEGVRGATKVGAGFVVSGFDVGSDWVDFGGICDHRCFSDGDEAL